MRLNAFKSIVFSASVFLLLFANPQADATVFKIGTISPEGSAWMQIMSQGTDLVAAKTDRRVRFKFYPGGVMGSDQAVLRKIRAGQLHGGAVIAGSLSGVYPDFILYGLPFTFGSLEEVDYVRERMDSKLMEGLEKNGFVGFGLAEGGFVYLMSKTPVRSVADLSGLKVWVPDNDAISLEAVKAFDVSPIPLSIGEVRTGLQTGLVDTIGTSPIGAIALQWHTQVNYLMDVPLLYVYATLVLDKKSFDRLSPEDQKITREIMTDTFKKLDRINRQDNIDATNALRNQGIEFVKPSAETVENWKASVKTVPRTLIEKGRISKDLYETMEQHLADFRSRNTPSNQ